MPSTQKISETGWFYHAPHKQSPSADPVSVPPASQIPGLAYDGQPPDEPQRMWIKDTDSEYVRLAKQGGRQDLLRFRSPKPKAEGPVGYPRCDWFYHDEALALENKPQETEPHEFLLPDYMVHNTWDAKRSMHARHQAENGEPGNTKPAPYAFGKKSIYQTEDNVTDKTVKLPEIRRQGYGIRQEKMQNKNVKHAPIHREKPIPQQSQMDDGKPKYKPMAMEHEEENPGMGKLLSHGYVCEWEKERDQWYNKQQRVKDRFDLASGNQGNTQTEYQENIAHTQQRRVATGEKQKHTPQTSPKSKKRTEQEEKELFKLSKFKNVPSKTDSRRNKDKMHHSENPIIPDDAEIESY